MADSLFPTVNPKQGLAGSFNGNPSSTLPWLTAGKNQTTTTPVVQTPVQTPVVQAQTQTAPVASPVLPPVNNTNTFTLDPSSATSSHLASDNTPDTVGAYRNQLQNNFDAFHAAQQPLQNLYSTTTAFSPQETAAMGDVLNLNAGLRSGINNIRSQNIPLEFQQGQEAALTRDTALRQQAAADTLSTLDTIRQNNLQAISSQIGFNQQNYQNQTDVNTTAQNYGIAAGGLGVQQQNANQGRYDYQQITDPNTGFPVIQVTDKQTGLPAGTISPSSSAGQTIMQNINAQGGATNTGTTGTATNGNAIVQSTMQMMGATQDMPVSQAIATLGINNVVKGLIGQEGGSPQGVVNNPGNIKFVGLPGQTNSGVQATDGGTFASYATPQAGTMAVANLVNGAAQKGANLSDFIASYKGVTNTAPQTQQTSMTQQLQTLVDNAPVQIKNGLKTLPDGTPYIDASQIPSQFLTVANAYSARTGVRVLSADDAKTMDAAKQAVANMQIVSSMFGQLAPTSALGSLGANFADPVKQLFDTQKGSALKAYNSNSDNLLQQIRTLAGSSPRLNANELNLAANSMPTLSEFSKNTVQDGINKLVLTQSYLDNAIRTIDPNYIGTPINIANQYAIQGPDGKAYTFPIRDAAMQALQIKNQTK